MEKSDELKGFTGSGDLHAKYDFIFKHAPLGILYLDEYGIVTACNERFAEIIGAPMEKYPGLKMLELPDENVRRVTAQVLAGEPSTYIGAYTSVFSGKTIQVSVHAAPLFDDDGRLVGGMAIFDDISDRKQWEEEVRKNTEMLEKFFDVNLDLLCIANTDGRFIKVNKAWERILGFPEKELLDKPYMNYVHPEDVSKTQEAMAQLMSEKEVVNFVNRYRTKKGDYRFIEWRSKPAENLVYAAARDITERLQAQDELKEAKELAEKNEALFKAIFDTSPAGIAIYNEDGDILHLNDAIEKIDGYPIKDEIGLNFAVRIHPDDLDMVINDVSDIFSGKQKRIAKDVRFIHKNGHTVWATAETMLFPFEFSGKKAVISALQDITGIKEAEKELQELNATKDKFMSIISHDLRSPFNSILGFTQLLLDDNHTSDHSTREKRIRIIQSVASNTLKLLDNLLAWARLQTGKLETVEEIINIKYIVNDLIVFFEGAANNKQIDLRNEIADDIFVLADRFMLDTILRNLITNAIKYSQAGGAITLGANKTDEWVKCSVSDTGVGMDESTRESLFKLGETRVRPGTRNEMGTGLGLILCKEFVEMHQGQIWVHSAPGKGSSFCFTLPAG